MKKPFQYNNVNESISRACALAAHDVFHPTPRSGKTSTKEQAIIGHLQNQFADREEGSTFDADGWLESISSEGQSLLESIKLTAAGELARTFETICYATVRPFIDGTSMGGLGDTPPNDSNESQYLLNNKMVSDLKNGRQSMIYSRAIRAAYDFKVPVFYYDPYFSDYLDPCIVGNRIKLLPWGIGKGCEVDAMRGGLQIIQHIELGCLVSEAMIGCFGYKDCPPSSPLGYVESPFEGTLWYVYQDLDNEDTQAWLAELRKNDTI